MKNSNSSHMWSEADGSQFLLVYGSWQAPLVQLICFDMYTRELKVSLKVDQSVIDVLKTYKRLGANLGVFAGRIAEVTPSWFLLMVGAVMNFSSYYLLHEVTRRSIRLQLWQICVCVFVTQQL